MTLLVEEQVAVAPPLPVLIAPHVLVSIVPICLLNFNLTDAIGRKQRFDGYVFRTHSNVNTWMSCARLCLLRSLCESFNYNHETGDCQINWKSAAQLSQVAVASFVTDRKWLYGDASLLPQGLVDNCANHRCRDPQVCAPKSTGGYTCLDIDACSLTDYTAITNAVFNAAVDPPQYTCSADSWAQGHPVAYCAYTESGFRWNAAFRCVQAQS